MGRQMSLRPLRTLPSIMRFSRVGQQTSGSLKWKILGRARRMMMAVLRMSAILIRQACSQGLVRAEFGCGPA